MPRKETISVSTIAFIIAISQIVHAQSHKIFLIPESAEGILRIVYNEACGTMPEKKGNNLIYHFPENKILILKGNFELGENNEFFLAHKDGSQTKLTQIYDYKNRMPHTIQFNSTGSIESSTLITSDTDSLLEPNNDLLIFTDLRLYNQDTTIRINDYKEEHVFSDLTQEKVNLCRSANPIKKGSNTTKEKKFIDSKTNHIGLWKNVSADDVEFVNLGADGYAYIVSEGDTLGGKSFSIKGIDAYMKYEIDYSNDPKSLDFVIYTSKNDVEIGRFPSIFRFEKNNLLVICMPFEPERPKDFQAVGTKIFLKDN